MKIKKCPECVRYIHFDGRIGVEKCWNCGLVTDFLRHPDARQKFWRWADSQLSVWLSPFSNLAKWKRCGQIALMAALPCAVVMLLIGNSLQIQIVRDAAAPFISR